LPRLQEIDIAVVKSTAAQFHVVPKEKHVRSKPQTHTSCCCSLDHSSESLQHYSM